MSIFKSSIGQKLLMAITGAALILFLLAHAIGNLQIYIGQNTLNTYAEFLQGTPAILWPTRIGLLVTFVIHIATAINLTRVNRSARPEKYAFNATVQASFASRYMLESGIVILVFLIVHLLRLTVGIIQPEHYALVDDQGRHDVYSMVISGFQNHYYSVGYILCMIVLGLHLSHAISSAFQTLGFNHSKYTNTIKVLSSFTAWGIAMLYAIIPLSIIIGVLP